MKKIIVGISAADGVQIGVRLLTLLREIPDVETHLVMSRNADTNLRLELGMDRAAAKHWPMSAICRRIWRRRYPVDRFIPTA